MLTAETETESLPSVTPHTHIHKHTHTHSVLTVPHLVSVLFMCCPRTLTSSPRLTSHPVCVWLPVFDYGGQPDGARERNGQQEKRRNWGRGGGGTAGRAKTRREGDLEEGGETLKDRLLRERERTGKRSLSKRLGRKTQGNWETKSEPGINREEEKGRDERREGGEGLGGCEARITQTFVTSSVGAQQMRSPDPNVDVVTAPLTSKLGRLSRRRRQNTLEVFFCVCCCNRDVKWEELLVLEVFFPSL